MVPGTMVVLLKKHGERVAAFFRKSSETLMTVSSI